MRSTIRWATRLVAILAVVSLLALGVHIGDRSAGGSNSTGGSFVLKLPGEKTVTLGFEDVYAAGDVDFTFGPANANVQFQNALNALPATGGRLVVVSSVQVNWAAAATVTRAVDNVIIQGSGLGTSFVGDGVTAIFTAGGNNWKFVDLRTDAGGLAMGATTGWVQENVLLGAAYVGYRSESGPIQGGAITGASITDSGLTAGRVTVAGVGGLLSDDADMTFSGSTLTVTTLAAPTGRAVTFTVCASNAGDTTQCDYTAGATDAEETIETAIAALPAAGGRISLSDGRLTINSEITIAANNITIEGQGPATEVFKANQVSSLLDTNANAGQPIVSPTSAVGFKVGQKVFINDATGVNFETGDIQGIAGGDITLVANLANAYTVAGGAYITTYYPAFYITGDRVALKSLTINGNRANQEDTSGLANGPDDDWGDVYLLNSDYSLVENVRSTGSWANGLNAISTTYLRIVGGEYDTAIANGVNFHQSNTHPSASQVISHNNADDGFECDNGSVRCTYTSNISFSNGDRGFKAIAGYAIYDSNWSIGDVLGFEFFGTSGSLTNNQAINSTGLAYYFYDASDVTMTGNICRGAGTAGVRVNATGGQTTSRITIADNDFLDCGNASDESTMDLVRASDFNVRGNTVTVTAANTLRAAIEVQATSSTGRVEGNRVGGVGVNQNILNSGTNVVIQNNDGHVSLAEVRDIIAGVTSLGSIRGLWVFNETSGTSINDSGSLNHDLTASSDLSTWTTKPTTKSRATVLDFDGAADYLYHANHADFSFGNGAADSPFSVVAVVRTDTIAAGQAVFLAKYDNTAFPNNLEWKFFRSGSDLLFRILDDVIGTRIGRLATGVLAANTWYVLVGTYDGAGAAGGVSVYQNGTQVDNANDVGGAYVAMNAAGAAMTIGREGGATGYLNGKGAVFGILGIELTADQVWSLSQRLLGQIGE